MFFVAGGCFGGCGRKVGVSRRGICHPKSARTPGWANEMELKRAKGARWAAGDPRTCVFGFPSLRPQIQKLWVPGSFDPGVTRRKGSGARGCGLLPYRDVEKADSDDQYTQKMEFFLGAERAYNYVEQTIWNY